MHFCFALMGLYVHQCTLFGEGKASQKILYCSGANVKLSLGILRR